MRQADITVVGGGLAGSLATAMLSRAGLRVVMIDPHEVYPPDFRCEKLDTAQVRILEKTGLAEAMRRASTPDQELWLAANGRILKKQPSHQLGFLYHDFVNAARGQITDAAAFVHGKVTDIATGPERQIVKTSDGKEFSSRLVVLANGLNVALREKLGLTREVISAGHSISIGFDARPVDRPQFPFPALTYFSERPAERMAYLTLFPIGATMRGNLFGYRDFNDPWLRELRARPQDTIYALMPGLRKFMGEFEVPDFVKIRPVDLYITNGHRQAGMVVVGDAFTTSCPAAGTGARKVLVDVERLCNVHVPNWLSTPGMGVGKISAFYDDPVKRECEEFSLNKAYSLRSFCTDTSLRWRVERKVRFAAYKGIGALRQARRWLSTSRSDRTGGAAAATGARS